MRNYIHINLCISLIVAQVTFVAGVEPRGSVVSTSKLATFSPSLNRVKAFLYTSSSITSACWIA